MRKKKYRCRRGEQIRKKKIYVQEMKNKKCRCRKLKTKNICAGKGKQKIILVGAGNETLQIEVQETGNKRYWW